jgi:hypothetical protein
VYLTGVPGELYCEEHAPPEAEAARVHDDIPRCGHCGALAFEWELLDDKPACVHCWAKRAKDSTPRST